MPLKKRLRTLFVLLCALGLASCAPKAPKPPVANCGPAAIEISNPNLDLMQDVRVTAVTADKEEYVADGWPPGEKLIVPSQARLDLPRRAFLNEKTHMPLGMMSIRCEAVSEINMTYKLNGQQLSMTGH